MFTIGRYERYNATGFDLTFYEQVLWTTAHGNSMALTLVVGDHPTNWISHVEPILLLLAPLKLIFMDTRWLLILQTLALALAAIPVYRIAARTWHKPWAGLLFSALYLLYPTVGWANTFDIHPITFATPLLLFAFDAAELKRYRLASVYLLAALLCKEEIGLIIACFGLYWFVTARWRFGLVWLIVGIVWALLSFFVIIPGAQGAALLPVQAFTSYHWLFAGTWSEKLAYISGPDTGVKLRFLIQLMLPLAFTPLLKPRILAIGSPALALSLLSTNLNQSSVYHQYMADVVPFLMIAAIKGTYEARTRFSQLGIKLRPIFIQRMLFALMVADTLVLFALFGPFTFIPRAPYAPIYGWQSGASLAGLEAASALIPSDSCLTTSNNIAAHYSQRDQIYVIGVGNYRTCERVLVDMADRRFISFGSPQAFACEQFHNGYQPIFYQDHVVVLQRGAAPALTTDFAAACAQEGAGSIQAQT